MDKSLAASAAGAIALATAGAVSALFLILGAVYNPTSTTAAPGTSSESITIEYVDEYGNPVEIIAVAPSDGAPLVEPIIETEYRYVTTTAPAAPAYAGDEYEEDEHDDHEEDDHDDHEEDDD